MPVTDATAPRPGAAPPAGPVAGPEGDHGAGPDIGAGDGAGGPGRRGGPGGEPSDLVATDERSPSAWSLGRVLLVVMLAAVVAFGGGYLVGRPDRPTVGSVDVGFVRDMIDHHDNAVLMGEAVVQAPDVDPTVRAFAREVVRWQRWEVGIMDAWLRDWGYERGDLDRSAMDWMAMPVPVDQMPGLQDDAALDRLRAATGPEADRLFLTMMREHHQAGVHMADYARQHAGESKVRELAAMMATNQAGEIREYDLTMARLGLTD